MSKAAIFDLDGTLIDSLPDILANVNASLVHHGFEPCDRQKLLPHIGYGPTVLLKGAIGEEVSDEKLKACVDFYNANYTNCDYSLTFVYDGIKEVMATLKERGFKIALLTNKPHVTTVKVYEKFLKDFGFDAYLGGGKGFLPKPDTAGTFYILDQLNVLPQNAYFIGDGDTDVITAKNAGLKGVSVLWGYRSKKDLEAVGATLFANTPKDLLDILI